MLKGPWLQIIFSLLSSLPGLIAKVEAANPNVPGEGKKLIVMDQVKTALTELDPVVGPMLINHPAIQSGLSTAVDVTVDLYNGSAKIVQDNKTTTSPAPTGTPVGAAATPVK